MELGHCQSAANSSSNLIVEEGEGDQSPLMSALVWSCVVICGPVIHHLQFSDDVVSPVLFRAEGDSQPLIVHSATLSSWPVAVAGLLKGGRPGRGSCGGTPGSAAVQCGGPTFPPSVSRQSMTMHRLPLSRTILQKSPVVFFRGPWVAM